MTKLDEEICDSITRLWENNLRRPLTPDVVFDQLGGAYTRAQVLSAVWSGIDLGRFDFTQDWHLVVTQ